MKECLYIGSSPCDEPCAQVGTEDYDSRSYKECIAYKRQLYRTLEKEFGKITDHLNGDDQNTIDHCSEPFVITVKSEPHDFGSYREVVIKFDTNNEKACQFAFWLDENCPANWDEEALEDLKS